MSDKKTCKDCTWYDDGRELCFMLNGLDVVHPAPHSTVCFAGALVHGQSAEIAKLTAQLADEQELTVAAYMSGAASQRDKIRELERMLAEADDAIDRVRSMSHYDLDMVWCPWCMAVHSEDCGEQCPAAKAKARIEARK